MRDYLSFLCGILLMLASSVGAKELPDFTQLIEQYGPAVVNISTTPKKSSAKEDKSAHQEMPEFPEGSPFNDFFRRFFDDEEGGFSPDHPSTSLGSGFILSKDGYVISNNHVIKDAEEIIVRLSDRRSFKAEVIGADSRSDIALLKISGEDLPTVKLGTSENLKVGEWVLAIGSPFGFDYSATAGIVSAKGRNLPSDNYVPFIQTDVAINPGNSGGPLFNMEGEVIGVNSQIYSRTGGFMGLSFAIPVDVMKDVVEQLKTSGKVSRGWLGVLIQDVNHELAESFGMEKSRGALVAKVLPDSPAKVADLQVGDIIVKFDGKEIIRSSDLPPIVGSTKVGTTSEATVIRQGKEVVLTIKIEELPSEDDIKLAVGKGGSKTATSDRLGLSVTDLEAKDRDSLGLPEGGVLIQRVEGSAESSGLQKGDVILRIGETELQNTQQFKEIVEALKEGQSVPVLVHRGGSPLFLALKVPKK